MSISDVSPGHPSHPAPLPEIPDELLDEVLERYLTGSASEREAEQVTAWATKTEGWTDQLRALRYALAKRRDWAADADVARAYQQVMARGAVRHENRHDRRRGEDHATTARFQGRFQSALRNRRSWSLAASVCVLMAVVGGIVMMRQPPSSGMRSEQTWVTKPGQQMVVRIADDARVTLAPATTLRVAAQRVVLDGEAYFQVTPSDRRPLTIQTPHAEVRVLGTRFTVRSYPGERASRVVVEDGKVALRARQGADADVHTTVATARTLAMISDSGAVVTPGIVVSDYTGWVQGQLSFDNAPVGDVIAELARAYGADIRVADSLLARQPLTMAVSVRQKPLGLVLEFVGRVAGARVTRTGDAYVLVRGRVPASEAAPETHLHRFPQPERQYGK